VVWARLVVWVQMRPEAVQAGCFHLKMVPVAVPQELQDLLY
jgi:hypothetical protein